MFRNFIHACRVPGVKEIICIVAPMSGQACWLIRCRGQTVWQTPFDSPTWPATFLIESIITIRDVSFCKVQTKTNGVCQLPICSIFLPCFFIVIFFANLSILTFSNKDQFLFVTILDNKISLFICKLRCDFLCFSFDSIFFFFRVLFCVSAVNKYRSFSIYR